MSHPRDIAADPNGPQARAANPARSAWVSANAGSGKTRVLTNRVARLLLGRPAEGEAGANPARILCLTFTKAAAAEMQVRLYEQLGEWALMDDDALMDKLNGLLEDHEPRVAPEHLDAARRLFAQALETPGGLRIQTIHAFCESLLKRFPLEAGLSPRYRLLDDFEGPQLRRIARDSTLALADRPGVMGAAARRVLLEAGEGGVDALCDALLERRRWLLSADPDPEPALAKALGATVGATAEGAAKALMSGFGRAAFIRLRDALKDGRKRDKTAAAGVGAALEAATPRAAFDALYAGFLTKDGAPPKTGLPSQDTQKAHPWIAAVVEDVQNRLMSAAADIRIADCLERSAAAFRFGRTLAQAYDAEKAARDALDFEDLIDRARRLLTKSEARAWVLFKLDGGIDHLLVDEAQDTSPAQWEIVTALAEEFLSGDGAAARRRTLFVVGDEKQSIYRFQGADPAAFDRTRRHFRERLGAALVETPFLVSFRSAPPVLEAVDRIFASDSARAGVVSPEEGAVKHVAMRDAAPGDVTLWPLLEPSPEPEAAPWWSPIDAPAPEAPAIRLAETLARTIAGWIDHGETLPARGRPIRPGDVMILVRSRGVFAAAMIRALKKAGVPVAGEDRMTLTDQIAVQDLLAMMRFALLPEDDLTLAALLRSPLIDLSEEALFDLAHGHARGRLWRDLRDRADERPDFAAAHAILRDMTDRADFLRPYEFLERALIAHRGRERLLARLGVEAEDAIDELLAQALNFEKDRAPSLQGFVRWIGDGDLSIKREMAARADEVRVMTVHGSKGLESNIVILPDTAGLPKPPKGIFGGKEGEGPLIWSARSEDDPPAAAALREAARTADMQEYRRLLYVAATRARDRLLICGWKGKNAVNPECWHSLAMAGLCEGAQHVETDLRDEQNPPRMGWRLLREGPADKAEAEAKAPAAPVAAPWNCGPVAAEPAPARPLRPSLLDEAGDDDAQAPGALAPDWAMRRGTLIHALLAEPNLPHAPLLARLAPDLPPETARALIADAGAVLTDPALAWIFAEGVSEAAIIGPVAALGRTVNGRIDRLIAGEDAIHLIDFKTGARPAQTPEAYLRQMALYAAALSEAAPGRRIHAHLLWIDMRALETLSAGALAAALDRIKDAS